MALRSLPKSLTLASFFTRSLTVSSTASFAAVSRSPASLLNRLRPLTAVVAELHRLSPADSIRTFATRATSSSLNDPNPNWSNRPPKETILLDGCDFNHWLVVMEPPEPNATRDEIIDSYIKTLAQIVGSEDEARMKIYSVSTRHYFAFGALVSEEDSYKIKELPKVRWVLPDSYLDVRNKDYGGEPFINGQAVPYDEKYHAEWVRNNARANERNRRNDRPRNFDRSRTFDRRRENMQNRQPMNNAGPSTIGVPPNNMNGNPANPNMPGAPPNQNVGGYAPANMNGPPASYNTTPPNYSGIPQNSNMGYRNVPPSQGGFGNVPPNQGGFGNVPPNQGGFGNVPPNQGGIGNVPPNQGGTGNVPPNQGGIGNVPPNQGGFGNVPPNHGGYGNVPPNQGGYGNMPPNQGGYGNMLPNQNGYGNMPPNQGGYGNVPPNQGHFSEHNPRWSQSNQNMRDAVPPNQNMARMQPSGVWPSNQQTFTPNRDMPGSPGESNSA